MCKGLKNRRYGNTYVIYISTPIKIPTTARKVAHVDKSEHLLEEENKSEKPA